ncbi:MAG: FAD-dependent oxidoreductase [Chloroflexi bacterium]|nr:FAD-dependent oxidoreductase [Chloroflexota bacterium]|tara:strand:+ start:3030 stop:4286 length:1257 start_codon:yes stop_codon:yes gene_type:complete
MNSQTHNNDVIVIGGGIIGICASYYLQKSGKKVVLLEQNQVGTGSSYGNTGWIVPSHSIPIKSPGTLQTLKWLLNPKSPFYIKPTFNIDLWDWLIKFRKYSSSSNIENRISLSTKLSQESLNLYKEIIQSENIHCEFEQKGIIQLHNDERSFEEGVKDAELLRLNGIKSNILIQKELKLIEPSIKSNIYGGIHFINDAYLNPFTTVSSLANIFIKNGGIIYPNTQVEDLHINGNKITSISTNKGIYTSKYIVLATGAWSSKLMKKIGVNLPIQPAKGYSISFKNTKNTPTRPLILSETRVGISPFNNYFRAAGTLELSGLNLKIAPKRIESIKKAIHSYIDIDLKNSSEDIWCGMRPLSPDGLPLIGLTSKIDNLMISTGHSTTGVTLAAVTGKIIQQLIDSQKPLIDIEKLSPNRFI